MWVGTAFWICFNWSKSHQLHLSKEHSSCQHLFRNFDRWITSSLTFLSWSKIIYILFLGFHEVRDSPLRSSPIQSPKVPRGHSRLSWLRMSRARGRDARPLLLNLWFFPLFSFRRWSYSLLCLFRDVRSHLLRSLIIFCLHPSGIWKGCWEFKLEHSPVENLPIFEISMSHAYMYANSLSLHLALISDLFCVPIFPLHFSVFSDWWTSRIWTTDLLECSFSFEYCYA